MLCTNTNKYIERIAGYLEMGFNPFADHDEWVKSAVEEKDDDGASEVVIQVIPASVQNDVAHHWLRYGWLTYKPKWIAASYFWNCYSIS